MARVDIPSKTYLRRGLSSGHAVPGATHACVVRPPSYGDYIVTCDVVAIEKLP
jgi:hypothetical protein